MLKTCSGVVNKYLDSGDQKLVISNGNWKVEIGEDQDHLYCRFHISVNSANAVHYAEIYEEAQDFKNSNDSYS
jgi:hypothetical protein